MKVQSVVKQLLDIKTYKSLIPAYKILVFYFVVMFLTSTAGHILDKKNGFTYGLYVGVVVSLVLWHKFGKSMAYL